MSPLLLPIVGMLIPIIIVPTALGLKHAKLLRELEHAERMKAMELGRTLPQDEPWWTPARICVTIGAGVPIGVFFCAWMTSASVGFRDEIWVAAAGVGITGVVSGSVLAAKHFAHRARAEGVAGYPKPMMDADAFDVAGSRG